MKFSAKLLLICVCLSIILGCAQTNGNAGFDNFKTFIRLDVGKSLYERSNLSNKRKPISITKLTNGNDEYRYLLYNASLGRHPCIVIYEVNPQTEIVVRSSFIGDENGCVIVP